MATPAQIAANQANAAHSTGPRTEEGKSKSRANSTRHGLCATAAVLSGEDQTVFNLLHDDLLAEYQPATPTEEILVFKMAVNFFSFARAENALAERLDANLQGLDSKQVALLMRYQSTTDRHFNRNLNDLGKIQKERRCPCVQPDATTDPSAACSQAPLFILPTNDVQREDTGQEPRPMERDRSIGFVSSVAEATQPTPSEPTPNVKIGFVSQKAETQPAQTPHFASKTAVCVTCAREDNRAAYPSNQTPQAGRHRSTPRLAALHRRQSIK
jgi:hypothetical protein